MSWSTNSLAMWTLIGLAALNLLAIALWLRTARFSVVLARRASARSPVARGAPENLERPQPQRVGETRPDETSPCEKRLARDLDRWRRRITGLSPEAQT